MPCRLFARWLLLRAEVDRLFHIAVDPAQTTFEHVKLIARQAGNGGSFVLACGRDRAADQRTGPFDDAEVPASSTSRLLCVERLARHQAACARGGSPAATVSAGFGAGQVGEIDLTLAAVCGERRHHAPHGDAQVMRLERLAAELFGNDTAGPDDEIGQIIAEIELGRALHDAVGPRSMIPKKLALGLDEGGDRFSEKIMLKLSSGIRPI